MHRTISHKRTRKLKLVGYAWIVVFSTVTLILFCVSYGSSSKTGVGFDPSLPWKFLVTTIIGTVFVYCYYIRLKDVAIENGSLVISTARRTGVVPFEEVEAVRQTRWLSWLPVAVFFRRVTIDFRNETVFGRSVLFVPELPTTEFLGREEPIVAELRRAAATAASRENI